MTGDKLRKCPRCQGTTWDPDGGDCRICGVTGVVREDGMPVDYETASDYLDWLDEQKAYKRKW